MASSRASRGTCRDPRGQRFPVPRPRPPPRARRRAETPRERPLHGGACAAAGDGPASCPRALLTRDPEFLRSAMASSSMVSRRDRTREVSSTGPFARKAARGERTGLTTISAAETGGRLETGHRCGRQAGAACLHRTAFSWRDSPLSPPNDRPEVCSSTGSFRWERRRALPSLCASPRGCARVCWVTMAKPAGAVVAWLPSRHIREAGGRRRAPGGGPRFERNPCQGPTRLGSARPLRSQHGLNP